MIRRPLWLGAGVALGVGGTLWAEQRLRRAVDQAVSRMSPDHLVRQAVRSTSQLGQRTKDALSAARAERQRQEEVLKVAWDIAPEPRRAEPVVPVSGQGTVARLADARRHPGGHPGTGARAARR